jgi:transposase InsO family protein
VRGDDLSVDGSFVEANASKESRIPREQLAEAAQVNQTVRQYLVELEQQNPTNEPVHEQKLVSTTDPDATYATKGGTPARLGYYDNYLVDNHSCVIVGVQATAARMSQETVAAQDMIARFARWQGRDPESVVADATYGNGEFLQWLMERGITPYMHAGQCSAQEQPTLRSRAFYLSSRKQQLSLSGWRTAQLRRPECSQPRSRLYRQRQALWSMFAKGAMHKGTI